MHAFWTLLGQHRKKNHLEVIQLREGIGAHDLAELIANHFFPLATLQKDQRQLPSIQDCGEVPAFTVGELKAAINANKRHTAPGPDCITNKMLRNMPDTQLELLLRIINQAWESGDIQETWKMATVIPIPKPNKAANAISNLRPISLTPYTGKITERMALTRLLWQQESCTSLDPQVIVFRKHMYTQDAMLAIQEIYRAHSTSQLRAIVELGIKAAFDNVTHRTVLEGLQAVKPRRKPYNYVKWFLTNRTVTVKISEDELEKRHLTRGVPQGSILSPTLFSLALSKLPTLLRRVEDLHFAMNAGDITLWASRGSPTGIQETL
ncbi:hypothetical protein HPB49_021774 [Dermacentor silvarum]|uniref:Uncharacterized protein n=1 Tax=Dermacentor silvarum TaxID=543639 RepID=A0ACB8D074_DERSI|nr:hypothetical protein HPB49_021774 [Dermacentor silvarum]